MSADKKQDGLEFASFNLAEESAGEWESVSPNNYRPVAEVIKLDSFEIDFEPDEDSPQGVGERRALRNRVPLFVEDQAEEMATPEDSSSEADEPTPLPVIGRKKDLSVLPTRKRPTAAPIAPPDGDLFLGIDDGDDLPGLTEVKSGKNAAGHGAATGGGGELKDPLPLAEEPGDFGGLLDDLAETPELDEEDVLGSLLPLHEDLAALRAIPKKRAAGEEEGRDDGRELHAGEESRKTASAPRKRLVVEDQERVPLKLRGRLTGQEKVERKIRVAGQDNDPDALLDDLIRRPTNKKEADFSSLLDDFSAPDAWGRADGLGLPSAAADLLDEPEFDGLGLSSDGKSRAFGDSSAALNLEDEFSGVDLSSLPGHAARNEGMEVGIDTLLLQAEELSGRGRKKRRATEDVAADDVDLSGLGGDAGELSGFGDDLAGWGSEEAGEDELGLEGMGLGGNSKGFQPFSDGGESSVASDRLNLPPAGHAFVRTIERMRQRMPNARELTGAVRKWVRLLCSLPATIKEEGGLTDGIVVWISNLRALAGLEKSIFRPWLWSRTRLASDDDYNDDVLVSGGGAGLYGSEDELELPAGSIFGSDAGADEDEPDYSGWGAAAGGSSLTKAPSLVDPSASVDTVAPVEDWASAAAAGIDLGEEPEADSDMPPEDILPDEDLSFSTADMLMQDSELGLSDLGGTGGLEDEFDLSSDEGEAQSPGEIPVGDSGSWGGLWRAVCKLGRKWALLCYNSLDHHIGFQENWWKIVDFLAVVILTMAAAAFLSYWLYYS